MCPLEAFFDFLSFATVKSRSSYTVYVQCECHFSKDGQLSAISKKDDGLYHVIGEIVVVHEVTLAAAVTNLKGTVA